jgi:hypothetical protein
MAGTFAHITLVDSLCDPDKLDGISTLSKTVKHALTHCKKFCELGAVSPDHPYLAFDEGWGNVMHYWRTADLIRQAIAYFSGRDLKQADSQKALAWLFGYVAHVVTDLTIHPVVFLKVGAYEGHETEHRKCEMHQDVYIFEKLQGQSITHAEYIVESGIQACWDTHNHHNLDPAIKGIWNHCLSLSPASGIALRSGLVRPAGIPDIDKWQRDFVTLIDKFAEEGGRFPRLLRGWGEHEAIFYPEKADPQYIENLQTPEGHMHYEQVFARAQENVKAAWAELGQALESGSTSFKLANADLDTGKKDNADQWVYWGVA